MPTIGKFAGDREDLEEQYVRRGLSVAEKRAFRSSPEPERKSKLEVGHTTEQPSDWIEPKPRWMQRIAAKKAEPKPEVDVERLWVKPQHKKRTTVQARQRHYDKKKQKLKESPELQAKKRQKDKARKMRKVQGLAPTTEPVVLRPNPDRPAKEGGPPAWSLQPGGEKRRFQHSTSSSSHSRSWKDRIDVLAEDEGQEVFSLDAQEGKEWIRIDVGVDSCAATSCIAQSQLPEWPLLKAKGPSSYKSAARTSVDVLGVKRPLIALQDGTEATVNMRVLEPLHKSLFAVSELIKSCRVVFDLEEHGGSYLENRRTGSKTKVYLKNNIFVVPVWFKKTPSAAMLASQSKDLLPIEKSDPFEGQVYP